MELETIRFGLKFRLDTFMIEYCLPRVPKLRQISFYWNYNLSAPLLRDSIGHLERIVICKFAGNLFQNGMAKVAEMLPNVLIE
ncbi:unnamed protein product [Allacma fusca]|uniref:Uncharacterized protein n=1 Tax=Allacma fusca TaxID=39272 RepID=A0A8J2NLR6_9HEXA|nr:unnamed protein product [Allacma fusca]